VECISIYETENEALNSVKCEASLKIITVLSTFVCFTFTEVQMFCRVNMTIRFSHSTKHAMQTENN